MIKLRLAKDINAGEANLNLGVLIKANNQL